MKKKFFAVAAATAVMAASSMTAFATAGPEPITAAGNANTAVGYNVDSSFMVTIPESVTLGESIEISASAKIKSYENLTVKLTGTSESDNSFKLRTAQDDIIEYTIRRGAANGVKVLLNEAVLKTGTTYVDNVDTPATATLFFTEPAAADAAGDYTGTVTFTVSVQNNTMA